jgi:acetyl-CoA C-acetyltransferase
VQKIKLKSVAMTRIGKLRSGYLDLVCEAVGSVLAGKDPKRVGRVFFSSFAPTELCGIEDPVEAAAAALRERFPELDAPVYGPYKTGGESLFRALETFDGRRTPGDPVFGRPYGAAGPSAATHSRPLPGSHANRATRRANGRDTLMVACEKMTHVDAGTAAGLLAPRVNPIEKLYGATLPALGALVTRVYMRTFGVPYRSFHHVAVKNHRNAAKNPNAHFQSEIGIEDVSSSPLVADPLRRHHCAPMSDGAVACLLGASGEGVSFLGWGLGLDARLFHERPNLGRFRAADAAARNAFRQAGIQQKDVDVVEIHDAFSPFELINLEEMGFYRIGESWRALAAGELDVGARIAVNPSGGMKARGHPIGVCGLSSVFEVYTQLTGTAGARQQPGARIGVIQSAGGVSRHCYVFILGVD